MRVRHSESEGFGKAFYRKGSSVKRSGHSMNPRDSENRNFYCAHQHFPNRWLLNPQFPRQRAFQGKIPHAASPWKGVFNQNLTRVAPTVSYLWPTRTELITDPEFRKIGNSWAETVRKHFCDLGPGSCRITEIQITSCPSKKELLTFHFCDLYRSCARKGCHGN